MSIVEKAAEKLKALQPEPPESLHVEPVVPHMEAAPHHHAATIERLQERARRVDETVETTPPWPVDLWTLERVGLRPTETKARAKLADEMRRIKRPLLDNINGKGAKPIARAERIVITSAEPGEGKTFTTLNLALSLAREKDFEVLLVDGDIPKSDITRVLGLEDQPGLMDVLTDEHRHPAEVIVHTDVPNLLVVPVGKRRTLAAELFGSLRMEYVLEALGGHNRRRLMVFDSAPLLAASESQVLASHMGQVVMVVAAGSTRRSAVDAALQCMNDSQYVGLVLNKSRLPASENHYDSYYYYGRDPGNDEGDA